MVELGARRQSHAQVLEASGAKWTSGYTSKIVSDATLRAAQDLGSKQVRCAVDTGTNSLANRNASG
jgi:hypothetical protein